MIRVVSIELYRTAISTRMPFKYGITIMKHLPHVFVRASVEINGCLQNGIAADNLPPKWFTKDSSRDADDEIGEMIGSIEKAMGTAEEIKTAPSVFAFWRELYREQGRWSASEDIPPLLAHLGTSLVERAVLDAFARNSGVSFSRLVHDDKLGIDLGNIYPELSGSSARDWLLPAPLERIFARHTIGLCDPLTRSDIAEEAEVSRALPYTLEECIEAYGLRHFKIKISGDQASDLDRLDRIAQILAKRMPSDFLFTLDGNEAFTDVATLRSFFSEMATYPSLLNFLRHLAFLEQPFPRKIALKNEVRVLAREWPEGPPIIIDESDSELNSLSVALDLGYAGTSHKNCKGVFKGIANACRIAQLQREQPDKTFLLSGEDLANIGPVALLQDLAVQAVLGISSVERNGHHYFAGLSFWPRAWQSSILRDHGDLYVQSREGWPRVDLQSGQITLKTVNAAPFGLAFLPEMDALQELLMRPPG